MKMKIEIKIKMYLCSLISNLYAQFDFSMLFYFGGTDFQPFVNDGTMCHV